MLFRSNSKRLEALISQYRELKYPGVKIARLLFEKASGFFDQRRMLEACALLELAAGLDPTHGEVLQDLTIVKESLSTEQLLSLSGKQFQKIISDIYPGMEILIGWDKGFDELNEDLREFLINERLEVPISVNAIDFEAVANNPNRGLAAEELFSQSSRLLETNPALAKELLLKIGRAHV